MTSVQNTTKPLITREFSRRAADAWIRAADAGIIDAAELVWLLEHLPAEPARPKVTG
ncbi:hypothetical protein [Amycolatopsis sp. DG1A-15b]|jgi:hypothetical protein|uniref:hypothetical protein n=1 Tax=Amycolatopsis sp. DG1A-15b TaxID=3052846 RepID=UPI00255BD21C|nr:hypothetical protein [Amycolatopsis sp. DG1A-15b]WIX84571.1 hypothetical protein QRY02_25310 [Amycolatopsis sp. DG1A-15b]